MTSRQATETGAAHREHRSHPRTFQDNRYVYAVLSRRSGGISIGVNLNPDKHCNFDCVYCQVDRREMSSPQPVELARLKSELGAMLASARDGQLFAEPRFRDLPAPLKQIRDIALSGDGEPTQCSRFDEIARQITELAASGDGAPIPVVLITNATGLERAGVASGVDRIMAAGGAIWAKLDAGTEAYYRRVCGQNVPFERVLENLTQAARRHPITLQTCFFKLDGVVPPDDEIDAYTQQVKSIIGSGGKVCAIQLYSVARSPAQTIVSPLNTAELDRIARRIGQIIPDVPRHTFS